jgi:hypothetical protein
MGLSNPSISPTLADTDTLRMKLVRGDLVPRPFEGGGFITTDSVGATANINAAIVNKDGSGTAIVINVPAGLNGARVQVPFFGRAFGLTFRRSQGQGSQIPSEFSVRIDGVAYAVSTTITRVSLFNQVLEDSNCKVLITDDLPEGEHVAEITLVAPANGTDQLFLESYLVERRAGYTAVLPADVLLTLSTATVPTVAAAIYDTLVAANPAGTFGIGRRVSRIRWQNNSGAPITDLVVTYNNVIYAQPASIASHDAFELTFNPPIVMNSLWKHVSPSNGGGGGANFPYFVFGSY